MEKFQKASLFINSTLTLLSKTKKSVFMHLVSVNKVA